MQENQKFVFRRDTFRKIVNKLRFVDCIIDERILVQLINEIRDCNKNSVLLAKGDLLERDVWALRRALLELVILDIKEINIRAIATTLLKNIAFLNKVNRECFIDEIEVFLWRRLFSSIACEDSLLKHHRNFRVLQKITTLLVKQDVKNWQELKQCVSYITTYDRYKDDIIRVVNLGMVVALVPAVMKKFLTHKYTFKSKVELKEKFHRKFIKCRDSTEVQSVFLAMKF